MPAVGLTQDQHTRVFGPTDRLESKGPGRSRRCKVCGDWHRLDRPWPHNCRSEAPPRNRNLAAPQVAPPFEPFKAGPFEDSEVIGSRNDKREYMDRHGFVEYDAGVKQNKWAEEKKSRREIEGTVKRYMDTDTEYWDVDPRAKVIGEGDLDTHGADIDASEVDVIE